MYKNVPTHYSFVNDERSKTEVHDKRDYQSSSHSSVAIFQQHERMGVTFHNLFFTLGYVDPELKLSIDKLYCFHHELLNRFEISISQMTITLFCLIFSCLYHQTLTDLTNVASMWLIYLVFVLCFFVLLFFVLCLVPNVDSPFWVFPNVY